MKKYLRYILIAALCLSLFCILTACQTQRAEVVDQSIYSLTRKGVSLSIEEDLLSVEDQVSFLNDWEKNSLEYLGELERIRKEYDQLVVDTIADLQAKLDALPEISQIRLSSEDSINAAKKAYDKATEEIRAQVTGADKLAAAVARLEQVKADAWVPCEHCGGDGKVVCSLCGGKGSRQVNHTTPNGKTWKVSQECKTSSTCSVCSGRGGEYVED